MRICGEAEVFSGAGGRRWGLEQCFSDQIAPRVISIGIAPELFQATQNGNAAVGPRIPGRRETVQRVIRESLIASAVFVIGNAEDIAVVRARCSVACFAPKPRDNVPTTRSVPEDRSSVLRQDKYPRKRD
jgi:hypothetical protein